MITVSKKKFCPSLILVFHLLFHLFTPFSLPAQMPRTRPRDLTIEVPPLDEVQPLFGATADIFEAIIPPNWQWIGAGCFKDVYRIFQNLVVYTPRQGKEEEYTQERKLIEMLLTKMTRGPWPDFLVPYQLYGEHLFSAPFYRQTLQDLIKAGSCNLSTFVEILQQVIRGIEFLTSLGIIPFDIKPSNIFIESVDPPVAKIGDFGSFRFWSEWASEGYQLMLAQVARTRNYSPPEEIFASCQDVFDCSQSSAWTLGAMLLEIIANLTHRPSCFIDFLQVVSTELTYSYDNEEDIFGTVDKICRGLPILTAAAQVLLLPVGRRRIKWAFYLLELHLRYSS